MSRPRTKALPRKACKQCKKIFTPHRENEVFCKAECRVDWHEGKRARARQRLQGLTRPEEKACGNCEKTFRPVRAWQKFCTDDCRYADQKKQYEAMKELMK